MKKLLLFLAVLLTPAIAFAAPRNFLELAEIIVDIIDTSTGLLILAGIVVYFWGISTNILKMKDEGGAVFKNYILWGLIAIFVMVSIWGIIKLVQSTIFGGSYYDPYTEGEQLGSSPSFDGASFDDDD
jgi:hypothetical protein